MIGTPVFLSSIEYALGHVSPMADALGDRVGSELMRKLSKGGFAGVAVAERSALELARRAGAKVMARAEVSGRDIDAVVYATCSFWGDEIGEGNRDSLRSCLLGPLGLMHAPVSGVALAESGNLASALRVARNFLQVDGGAAVLVVTADRVPARSVEYRAMPNATAINSDAAAACLVSKERGEGFEIEHVAQRSNSRILARVKGDGFGKNLDIVAGIRAATRSVFCALGLSASDYRWLVTNNYSLSTVYGFADAIEMPRERVFLANIGRFAHAFAADGLINVADLVEVQAVPAGERLLALSTGPLTWGAISLRRC